MTISYNFVILWGHISIFPGKGEQARLEELHASPEAFKYWVRVV